MKNFKTTLAAALGYAIILINKYAGIDLPSDVVIGLVICIVALVSKDYDTTGVGDNASKTTKY